MAGRPGILATAVAALALLVAACGGSSGGPAAAGETAYQEALAYAQCMRSHGEPGWPDPTSNGGFIINGQKDGLASGSIMAAADKACHHLLPNGGRMTRAQQEQALSALLKFAACMRSHGLTNFPDPTTRGGVNISLSGGISPSSPQFKSAQRACRPMLPGGGP